MTKSYLQRCSIETPLFGQQKKIDKDEFVRNLKEQKDIMTTTLLTQLIADAVDDIDDMNFREAIVASGSKIYARQNPDKMYKVLNT